jgi:hypothetical protein
MADNGFTGPILASITALTRLVDLYAPPPPPPCGLPADSEVRRSPLWRRYLNNNRFSGSLPSTISVLTALTDMCAPTRSRAPADAAHASLHERVAARWRFVPCGRMLHCA